MLAVGWVSQVGFVPPPRSIFSGGHERIPATLSHGSSRFDPIWLVIPVFGLIFPFPLLLGLAAVVSMANERWSLGVLEFGALQKPDVCLRIYEIESHYAIVYPRKIHALERGENFSQLYQTCLPLPSPPPPASSSSSFSSTSAPPSPMETFVAQKTNKVDGIDPILRRSGRFDAEIEVSTPNEEECFQIIKLYTKKIPMDSSADLQVVAASCNGYFGADLEALCRKASISAIKHSFDLNEDDSAFSLTMEDWKHDCGCFMKLIILAFSHGQKKLQQAVEWPFKHSTSFIRLGITLVCGILLHGHPGCSKTTLAKAAAHVAQASFFSLSGAELYSMYAGDGEPLLLLVGSSLLARISSSTPAIIDASCLSAEGCCCC
ncbi:hypothetical protein UlMin_013029 [Ulmus minor]